MLHSLHTMLCNEFLNCIKIFLYAFAHLECIPLEQPEKGRMHVPLWLFLAINKRAYFQNSVALILFQLLFFFFSGGIFSYCPVSSLLLSFIYVGAGSITSAYSLGHSGWLSDKFQMLQSWLSCKLSRIASLLAYAQHFIRLDSKCCESETYTVKLRLFSKERLWI